MTNKELHAIYVADKCAGDWHRPFENYCAGYHAGQLAQPESEPVPKSQRQEAYASIDRLLRNRMDDEEYAYFSTSLDTLYAGAQQVAVPIEGLPDGATHISKLKASVQSGGRFEMCISAFKYEDGNLMVFDTDNDNEYPCWTLASRRFKAVPRLVPLYAVPRPKSLAECRVGPCDCDPHIEYCEQCFPTGAAEQAVRGKK